MESKELLTRLLNFGSDWEVRAIQVNEHFKEVDITIEYSRTDGVCPLTKEVCSIYDYRETRRYRHLDILDYKTYINARIPRVRNSKKDVNSIEVCWAGGRVSYTYLFEARVIDALRMSHNQTKTASFFDTTFDIVHGIMQRGVERGLKRRNLDGTMAISLDEKSVGDGQSYITILSDPLDKSVIDVIEGRKVEDVEELLTWALSPSQLERINLVTMDMWKPYMIAVEEIIPDADIVHDKFHTAKYLNKGVDEVRKQEVHKEDALKKTKYLFLKNKENWTASQALKFDEVSRINLVTSQAWHMKENFKGIYDQDTRELCLNYFKQWYTDVIETGIKQMVKVADTLLNHLKGIVNAAVRGITNSMAENLNSKIQVIKSVGRGYKNVSGYRNAILFFQGNLLLYPL